MKALLIEWEANGKRAGDINPKDPNLQCYGWQNQNVTPMLELRIVEDNRDLAHLEGIKGVTILIGKEAINQAIDNNFPPKIFIQDKLFFEEHVKEQLSKGALKISELPDDYTERLKKLKNVHHIKGIVEKQQQKV